MFLLSILPILTVVFCRESWSVIPDIFESLSSKIGGSVCLDDYARGQDSAKSYTFKEVNDMIIACAGALQERYGVTPDEAIAIFAENSCNWFLVDQAIMKVATQ